MGTTRRRVILSVAVLVAFSGCRIERTSSSPGITVSDSAGVSVVVNVLDRLPDTCATYSEPRVTIGQAIGEDPYHLYRVFGATVLSDGRIALVNQGSQELRVYGPDGSFLFASGRRGDGPGEFQNAFYLFRLPGDTLWVGDYGPWQFELFTPSGEWIRQVRPSPAQPSSPQGMGVLADGRAVLAFQDRSQRSPNFTRTDMLHVLLYDSTGALLDTLAVSPYGRWGQVAGEASSWVYPWFEAVTELAVGDERFAIGHGNVPEMRVFRLESEPELERIIRWTGVDQSIDPSDLAVARAEIEARYADMSGNPVTNVLLSDQRPTSDSMPVMSDVQFGTDGALWVQEYARPTDSIKNRWLQFDGDGRFTCRLVLPPGLDVYEFGSNYVLGKGEGEFRAEQVVLYDFDSP